MIRLALLQSVPGMRRAYEELDTPTEIVRHFRESHEVAGDRLLRMESLAEAATAFRWNANAYPESANVHDSLGDAYR